MVKIGEAWMDLANVLAVVPARDEIGYSFFLSSGRILTLPVSEEDVLAALEGSGLVVQEAEMQFSAAELEELADAYSKGFRYVAKDSVGWIYAYSEEPVKAEGCWQCALIDEGAAAARRLRAGDYDALDFETSPLLDLQELFREE